LDVGHILANLAFIVLGLVFGAYAWKLWRVQPDLPRLDETSSEAFIRGCYKPAQCAIVAGSPWFVSLGLFAFAMYIEDSVRSHVVKDLVWIPCYLFLASAILWGIMYFVLFFTGRPRALVPPTYRDV
jgi:hypothetical protein